MVPRPPCNHVAACPQVKGVSGGQRKRVSIAMEFVARQAGCLLKGGYLRDYIGGYCNRY